MTETQIFHLAVWTYWQGSNATHLMDRRTESAFRAGVLMAQISVTKTGHISWDRKQEELYKELTEAILPMTAEYLSNASPLTALEAERNKAKREALLEAAEWFSGKKFYGQMGGYTVMRDAEDELRRMADEIGE